MFPSSAGSDWQSLSVSPRILQCTIYLFESNNLVLQQIGHKISLTKQLFILGPLQLHLSVFEALLPLLEFINAVRLHTLVSVSTVSGLAEALAKDVVVALGATRRRPPMPVVTFVRHDHHFVRFGLTMGP